MKAPTRGATQNESFRSRLRETSLGRSSHHYSPPLLFLSFKPDGRSSPRLCPGADAPRPDGRVAWHAWGLARTAGGMGPRQEASCLAMSAPALDRGRLQPRLTELPLQSQVLSQLRFRSSGQELMHVVPPSRVDPLNQPIQGDMIVRLDLAQDEHVLPVWHLIVAEWPHVHDGLRSVRARRPSTLALLAVEHLMAASNLGRGTHPVTPAGFDGPQAVLVRRARVGEFAALELARVTVMLLQHPGHQLVQRCRDDRDELGARSAGKHLVHQPSNKRLERPRPVAQEGRQRCLPQPNTLPHHAIDRFRRVHVPTGLTEPCKARVELGGGVAVTHDYHPDVSRVRNGRG